MKKKFSVVFLMLYAVLPLAAQADLPKVYVPSPEASALMRYIDYPVNYGTGLVQIDIPLYEIKTGDLTLPISLSYHASGLKVQEADGWVAAGWTLNAEPTITRSIKGAEDEKYLANSSSPTDNFFYRNMLLGYTDEEPDVFYYKLANKSGGFHFRREDVTSRTDTSYDIIVHPCEPVQITTANRLQQFKITDENGIYYLFEKREQNECLSSPSVPIRWTASAIQSHKTNEKISFQYSNTRIAAQEYIQENVVTVQDDFVSCTRYTACPDNSSSCAGDCGIFVGKSTSSSIPTQYKVTADNTLVTAGCNDIVKPTSLQYCKFASVRLRQIDFANGKIVFESDDSKRGYLNRIKIYEGDKVIRTIRFNRRPTLDGEKSLLHNLEITGAGTDVKEMYAFDYYGSPPSPYTRCVDHWGYYNGGDDNTNGCMSTNSVPKQRIQGKQMSGMPAYTFEIGESNRAPNPESTKQGILQSIKYPTGGTTVFDYEGNRYCPADGTPDCASSILTGGLRIVAIRDYDADGTQKMQRIFKYGKNENGAGYLYWDPVIATDYMYTQQVYYYRGNTEIPPYRLRTYLPMSPAHLFYSGGAPVVYDYVTEYRQGSEYGKTVYQYDNIPHTQSQPSYDARQRVDYRDGWRHGRLTAQTEYKYENGAYTPVRTRTFTYSTFEFADKATRVGNILAKNVCYQISTCNNTYQDIGAGLKDCPDAWYKSSHNYYYYTYTITNGCRRLKEETVQDYYTTGAVTTKKEYTYDTGKRHLLPGTVTVTTSRDNASEVIVETFRYPEDVQLTGTAETARLQLIANNRLATLLEQNSQQGAAIKKTVIPYGNVVNGPVLPEAMQTNSGADGTLETRIRYKAYTSHGNPLSIITKEDDETVYLWGYRFQYPIAEIKGATYDAVKTVLGENFINNLAEAANPNVADLDDRLRNGFKDRPVWITTYIYKPLTGIISQTDPNGITTYYEYDDFNRLKIVRDHEGHVLKQYEYHYH
jgi:YD repeat-containing protein